MLRAYICLIFAFSTIGAEKASPDLNKISIVPGIDIASLRDTAVTTIRLCKLNADLAGKAINGTSRHATRSGCLGAVPIVEDAHDGRNRSRSFPSSALRFLSQIIGGESSEVEQSGNKSEGTLDEGSGESPRRAEDDKPLLGPGGDRRLDDDFRRKVIKWINRAVAKTTLGQNEKRLDRLEMSTTRIDGVNDRLTSMVDTLRDEVGKGAERLGKEINRGDDQRRMEMNKLDGDIIMVVDKLGGDINRLDVRLTGEINKVDQRLSGDINKADQRINTLDEKVVGQIGEFRRDMDVKFERLLHQIREQFDSLQKRVDGRFDTLDGRFNQVDGRFNQVDGRFNQVDGRFNQSDSRLGKVEMMIIGAYCLVTAAMVAILASSRAPPSELDSFVGSMKHFLELIPLVNKLPFVGKEKTNKT
jgi:hypothetical protein